MKREDVLRKGPYPMLIDGREVPSQSRKTFASVDPSTGQKLAEVYEADEADVGLAVEAARRAFDNGWRLTLPKERSRKLMKLAELLNSRIETMSWIECYDAGKPITASRAWLAGAPATLEYYAGCLLGLSGETLDVSDKTLFDFTLREPLGVCGLIVPWNFPLSIALLKMAPALAAGNCVVVKPSELTPLSTVELGALIAEAGFPPGVVNIVNGPGPTVGSALVRDSRVAKISFTGGTESGKRIYRESADTVKRLTLELGGKSALLVFADADIERAVEVAFSDIVRNSGQVCGACTRVMLQAPIADRFLELLEAKLSAVKVGPPEDPQTQMGPVVSAGQAARCAPTSRSAATKGPSSWSMSISPVVPNSGATPTCHRCFSAVRRTRCAWRARRSSVRSSRSFASTRSQRRWRWPMTRVTGWRRACSRATRRGQCGWPRGSRPGLSASTPACVRRWMRRLAGSARAGWARSVARNPCSTTRS